MPCSTPHESYTPHPTPRCLLGVPMRRIGRRREPAHRPRQRVDVAQVRRDRVRLVRSCCGRGRGGGEVVVVQPRRGDVVADAAYERTSLRQFGRTKNRHKRAGSRIRQDDDHVLSLDASRDPPPFVALEPLERGVDGGAGRAADEEALGADQALAGRERVGVVGFDPVRDVRVGQDGGDLAKRRES